MYFKSALFAFVLLSLCGHMAFAQRGLKKANKQYELKAFSLAAQSYKNVLDRSPNVLEAIYKLADCYRHLNQMEEAAKWYERAVQFKEVPPPVYLQYGHVLKALGQFEQARKWFLKYSTVDPVWANQMAESCRFAMEHIDDPPRFEVVAEAINSTESDFGPSFLNRQQIVFGSARQDIKPQGVNTREWIKKSNLLFRAQRDSRGFLSNVAIYHRDPASHFNEGPVAFSPDGRTVVITKNNFVNGTRQIPSAGLELSLFIATVAADGTWTGMHPFPHNMAGYSTGFAAFSEDGQMLYFASDRPGGFGGFDLYVSVRQGNSWSAPENLGPVVNSPGHELTPYVVGNTLYFASDWHAGFGGFDLFKSERTTRGFTTLINLGPGVNSTYDDYSLTFDPVLNIGYLCSNRPGGQGLEDIYRVSQAGSLFTFRVLDAATRTPIANATIDFGNCGQQRYHTDANGMYSFQLVEPIQCKVIVQKEGYVPATLNFTSSIPNSDRIIEILLTNAKNLYTGRVVDAQSTQPLGGVHIRATHIRSQQFQEVISQSDGSYQLALQPNASYLIRYSMVGYREINRTVHTGDGTDKSILGIVSLPPVTTPLTNTSPSTSTAQPAAPSGGWAIQLAAVRAYKQPDLSPFQKKLGTLGPIYVMEEKGMKKVRLGPFELRQDAEAALAIVKARGFRKAFIVAQSPQLNTLPPAASPSASPGRIANPGVGPYKVQVGAFSSMRFFDESKLLDLGVIEKRAKGQLTVVLLSGFDSLEDARAAARVAEKRGFKGAFVVQEVNGQLVKVR